MYNDWFIPKKFVIPVDHCGNHCACERDDGVVRIYFNSKYLFNAVMLIHIQTDCGDKETPESNISDSE